MILAENLEAPCCSWPFISHLSGVCPACSEPLGDPIGLLNSFSCCLGPSGNSEGLPSVIWEGLSPLIMLPYKSFRSNTSTTLWNCSFQKTYGKVKSFRMRTYKKQGGRGYYC